MIGVKILHEHRWLEESSGAVRTKTVWDIIALCNGKAYELRFQRPLTPAKEEYDVIHVNSQCFNPSRGTREYLINHMGFPVVDLSVPTKRLELIQRVLRLSIQITDGE